MTARVLSIQGEVMAAQGPPQPDIPDFEGNTVAATRGRVTGSGLDINDEVFRIDEVVRMVVEARVEGINHTVDKDGKLVRVHAMKVVDSLVIEWDQNLEVLRDGLR